MSTNKQSGSVILTLAIVALVIGVVVFAGYKVYIRNHPIVASQSVQPATASNVSNAPQIQSNSDLDKAAATLDQNDPATTDSTDTTQLDSLTGTF